MLIMSQSAHRLGQVTNSGPYCGQRILLSLLYLILCTCVATSFTQTRFLNVCIYVALFFTEVFTMGETWGYYAIYLESWDF